MKLEPSLFKKSEELGARSPCGPCGPGGPCMLQGPFGSWSPSGPGGLCTQGLVPCFVKAFVYPYFDEEYMSHYEATRHILFEMGGIQRISSLPDDPNFSQTDNKYDVASYERICAEFGVRQNHGLGYVFIHYSDGDFAHKQWQYPTPLSNLSNQRFSDEGGTDSAGNKLECIRNDQGVDRQFEFFVPDRANGLTPAGLAWLKQSIEAFVYCILGAQVNVRSSIVEQPTRFTRPHKAKAMSPDGVWGRALLKQHHHQRVRGKKSQPHQPNPLNRCRWQDLETTLTMLTKLCGCHGSCNRRRFVLVHVETLALDKALNQVSDSQNYQPFFFWPENR